MTKPLISVITSTYQAAEFLPITIESIKRQKATNFEWIIVDGGSTDGTVDVIKNNQDIICAWISEKDNGIYNAWNKAVKMARGEWVIFIGAGDELYSADVFVDVAPYLQAAFPKYELVYGSIQLISGVNRAPVEVISRPWNEMKNKWDGLRPMLPVHPEVFHHKTLFENKLEPFPEQFRIVSDSFVLLRSIQNKDPLFIPVIIDKMLLGGVSANLAGSHNLARETKQMLKLLGIKPPAKIIVIELIKLFSKVVITKIFPLSIQNCIADAYRLAIGKGKKWTIK